MYYIAYVYILLYYMYIYDKLFTEAIVILCEIESIFCH